MSGVKRGYVGASCACPQCQEDARFVNRRERQVLSLFGALRLQRCYYHCRQGGHGYVPWDQELGLGAAALTPAAAEVTSLAGVQSSFAQASEITLRKMCGLWIGESTVERVTESAGERLKKLLAEKVTFGEERQWDWQRDAEGHSCAYVSLDATGVRQQGEKASRAEGRMAYVGMIYNPRGSDAKQKPQPHQVRYLAGFYQLPALGLELRRQAAQVGWDEAEQQIALSDGGNGLEEFMRQNFPKATCILDFWHAKEYLVELSQACFGEGTEEGRAWLDRHCHQLKHEGGAATLASLEASDLSQRTTLQETYQRVTNYFRNNLHRMDYPRYVAKGWQIGSGPVESACKTVGGNRLKGSGMRWGKPGSDAACRLRALYLSESGQWDAFWKAHPA